MLKEVENKIQELRNQQRDEYYKQKEIDLQNWGLTKNNNKKNSVSIIVTDDEYEALIEASAGVNESGRNFTASLLNIASAAVLTLGIIAGIACAILFDQNGFMYLSACVIASILLALIFRGLAVAIGLLQQIVDTKRAEDFKKLHEQKHEDFPEQQPNVEHRFTNAPPVHYAYPTDPKTVEMPK